MVRITRRDFLKYCAISAGALGLSASTMMKLEKAYANPAAPTVVWISGAACTGCTMTLLNSVFYTTVDDLLINRINLRYLDTAMATAGAYTSTPTAVGTQYSGANSLAEAQAVYSGTAPFVLVVEGGIQTAENGEFCRIGDLTGSGNETMVANVTAFANHASCIAVLAVGTCSSFGGIPGARGNVTGCQGVAFSGNRKGGAVVANSGTVSNVHINSSTTHGSGYTATPTVSFSGGGGTGAAATAVVAFPLALNTIATQEAGSGYTAATVSFWGGGGSGAVANATVSGGAVTQITITNGGSGYIAAPIVVIEGDGSGAQMAPGAAVLSSANGVVHSVTLTNGGSGYTSAPTVSIEGGTAGTVALATALITSGNVTARKGTAAKVINISGCPPHPDWIVGTIAHVLDTALTLPPVNATYQPVDYGYAEYQCNAGPCPWRYNNRGLEYGRYPLGDSKRLGREKWTSDAQGCLGILGCKGRKTKADCSRRKWNSDAAGTYGVNWCVGSRGNCQGCTAPEFPDKVGKFYTFV